MTTVPETAAAAEATSTDLRVGRGEHAYLRWRNANARRPGVLAVVFHQTASAPPARSTRNASGTDRPGPVHCQDRAYVMRSQEASAGGSASSPPRTKHSTTTNAVNVSGHSTRYCSRRVAQADVDGRRPPQDKKH